MQWWLSVFFLVHGHWVPGATINGWHPRAFESEAHCLEHKTFAERECRDHPLLYEAVWVCTPGKPASDPPPASLSVSC